MEEDLAHELKLFDITCKEIATTNFYYNNGNIILMVKDHL